MSNQAARQLEPSAGSAGDGGGGKRIMSEMTTEKVQELMDMLTGESLPSGFEVQQERLPSLTRKKASFVVWFLQEQTGVIPDNFEMCSKCGSIYDSYEVGNCIDIDSYETDSFYVDEGIPKSAVDAMAGSHFCTTECETYALRRVPETAVELTA